LVHAILDNVLVKGIMNIGVRPTISPELKKQIEIHIFDFERDIYGMELKVEILTRLRNEIKFANKEALIEQIQHDISLAHRYFSNTSM
jgi:riboflavin kinase/FMN adenylyltransferase